MQPNKKINLPNQVKECASAFCKRLENCRALKDDKLLPDLGEFGSCCEEIRNQKFISDQFQSSSKKRKQTQKPKKNQIEEANRNSIDSMSIHFYSFFEFFIEEIDRGCNRLREKLVTTLTKLGKLENILEMKRELRARIDKYSKPKTKLFIKNILFRQFDFEKCNKLATQIKVNLQLLRSNLVSPTTGADYLHFGQRQDAGSKYKAFLLVNKFVCAFADICD